MRFAEEARKCMDGITAREWELLGCFGVEPQLLDPDVPWCYNDAVYEVEVDRAVGVVCRPTIVPRCATDRLPRQ
jgi:hypothetical protein